VFTGCKMVFVCVYFQLLGAARFPIHTRRSCHSWTQASSVWMAAKRWGTCIPQPLRYNKIMRCLVQNS